MYFLFSVGVALVFTTLVGARFLRLYLDINHRGMLSRSGSTIIAGASQLSVIMYLLLLQGDRKFGPVPAAGAAYLLTMVLIQLLCLKRGLAIPWWEAGASALLASVIMVYGNFVVVNFLSHFGT